MGHAGLSRRQDPARSPRRSRRMPRSISGAGRSSASNQDGPWASSASSTRSTNSLGCRARQDDRSTLPLSRQPRPLRASPSTRPSRPRCIPISPLRSPPRPRQRRRRRLPARARGATISTGSPKRSRTPPAPSASPPQSSGSAKAKAQLEIRKLLVPSARFDIASGRIFERAELALTGDTPALGVDRLLSCFFSQLEPVRPPAALVLGRAGNEVAQVAAARSLTQYWYFCAAGGLTTPAMCPDPASTNRFGQRNGP